MNEQWVNLLAGGTTLLALVVLVTTVLLKKRAKKDKMDTGGDQSGGTEFLVKEVENVLLEHQGVAEAVANQLSPDQLLKALKVVERVVVAVATITPNQVDDKVAQALSKFIKALEENQTLLNLLTKVVNTILSRIGK